MKSNNWVVISDSGRRAVLFIKRTTITVHLSKGNNSENPIREFYDCLPHLKIRSNRVVITKYSVSLKPLILIEIRFRGCCPKGNIRSTMNVNVSKGFFFPVSNCCHPQVSNFKRSWPRSIASKSSILESLSNLSEKISEKVVTMKSFTEIHYLKVRQKLVIIKQYQESWITRRMFRKSNFE